MTLSLGFDTSGGHVAGCLIRHDTVLAEAALDMARGQAEALLPLLEGLLAEARCDWRDLDVIGAGTGPGNFTGIRLSVAAARGLALGLGIPAVGVTAFEATAAGRARPFAVTVPGPRGMHYLRRFDASNDPPVLQPDGTPCDIPLVPRLAPPALVRGISRLARDRADSAPTRPVPCYIKPADAAPARDTGPVMLPSETNL